MPASCTGRHVHVRLADGGVQRRVLRVGGDLLFRQVSLLRILLAAAAHRWGAATRRQRNGPRRSASADSRARSMERNATDAIALLRPGRGRRVLRAREAVDERKRTYSADLILDCICFACCAYIVSLFWCCGPPRPQTMRRGSHGETHAHARARPTPPPEKTRRRPTHRRPHATRDALPPRGAPPGRHHGRVELLSRRHAHLLQLPELLGVHRGRRRLPAFHRGSFSARRRWAAPRLRVGSARGAAGTRPAPPRAPCRARGRAVRG